MHVSRHGRSLSTIARLLTCALVSCSNESTPGGPTDPEPPTYGLLQVSLEVEGPRPDPDGFLVAVTPAPEGSRLERPLTSEGGIIQFPHLSPGTYIVQMEGLAENCRVSSGQHPRAVTVRAGASTEIVMTLFCAGPGTILVTTVSRGSDVQTAGYRVTIAASSVLEAAIAPNDSLLLDEEGLPEGTPWEVTLHDVPEHCTMSTPNPRFVGPLRGGTVRVEYAIACIPPASRIAFEMSGQVIVTDGAGERNLTNTNGFFSSRGLSLSPDGSRILFSSLGPDLAFDLYLVDVDGTGPALWSTSPENKFVGTQAWSPDGSRFVFWGEGPGRTSDIYAVNLDGSGLVRLTHDGASTSPAWSPDGAWIAFCRFEGGFDGWNVLYRMRASDGSGLERLVGGACDPSWSPDGTRIAFTSSSSSSQDLVVALADGAIEAVLPLHPPNLDTRKPSWSPDGDWIAFNGPAGRIWIVRYEDGLFGEAFPYRWGAGPSWR